MTDDPIELTRRRVLGCLLTVGGAGAAAGAGTMAAFSDTETSTGNTIQAGTLDLTLDGESEPVTFFENDTAIEPGDSNSESVTLGNAGSVEGTVELVLHEVTSSENGITDSEASQGDETEEEGELQDYLDIRAELDGTEILDWTRASNLFAIDLPESYTTDTTIAPQTSNTEFLLEWRFTSPEPPNHKDVNVAQGDSLELDIVFRLGQTGGA